MDETEKRTIVYGGRMRHSRLLRWAIIGPAWVLVALACGSDSDDDAAPSCGTFAVCGGDPSGSWRSSAVCVAPDVDSQFPGLPPECDGAVVLEEASEDQTLTFGADGMLTLDGTASLTWAMTFGPDCITAAAGGIPVDEVGTRQVCDGLRNDFAANATEGRSVEATCTAAGTTCSCNVRLEVTRANTTIPITIEGDTLVYSDGTRQDFCVKGDQLDLGPAQGAGIDNSYSIHVRADP